MIAQKLKKLSLQSCVSTLVLFFALVLLIGSRPTFALGPNDAITEPGTFCTQVLKGQWRVNSNIPDGECFSGTSCTIRFENEIPRPSNCDSSAFSELKGKKAGAVIALLSNSKGLPEGATNRLTSYHPTEFGGSTATGSRDLDDWLESIINLLSALVGIVVVISLIFAGYMYMTARDNASQVAAAKQRILMSVLALLLFAFAYLLLQWLIPGGVFS